MPKLKVSGNKEVRELVKWAEDELGYVAERTGGGHIRFLHDDVAQPIFCSSSPSDYRARRNVEALLISALAEVSNKEFKRDPLLLDDVEVVPGAAFICPSCRNHGVEKIFVHPQGLASHMSEEHPAPPLEPEPELEAAPSERAEEEEPVPNEEKKTTYLQTRDLERYLWQRINAGELSHGDTVKAYEIRAAFPDMDNVSNAVSNLRLRPEGAWLRMGYTDTRRQGVYTVLVPEDVEAPEEAAPDDVEEGPTEDPTPDEVFAKVDGFAEAKIFEEINRFVDGKLLLRDAEGHLYQAEIERLS